MASLDEITDRLRRGVADGGIDSTVLFDLKGEGFIHLDGPTVTNADAPADCVVTVSKADLEAIARGELDPTMAVMTGRLKVSDMGVAMKLAPLLSKGRG